MSPAEDRPEAEPPPDAEEAEATEADADSLLLSTLSREGDENEDGAYVRSGSRGELEVLDVNFCGRAQRRLARHARRARIPLVARALVVEEEFVDVDQVSCEVHDAEPDRTLRMEVSSGEEDVADVAAPERPRLRRPAPAGSGPGLQSAALSINSGRMARLARPKPKAKSKRKAQGSGSGSAGSVGSTGSGSLGGRESFDTLPTSATERLESDGWGAAGFEGQPSSSSSSWAWPEEEPSSSALPALLQVPLSPEHASPAEEPGN